jgi:hypothetical protein
MQLGRVGLKNPLTSLIFSPIQAAKQNRNIVIQMLGYFWDFPRGLTTRTEKSRPSFVLRNMP